MENCTFCCCRWANASGSSSSISMNRSGPIGGSSSALFSGSGSYSDAIPSMGMMSIPTSASYNDRFDAYKSGLSRKY